jgi:integrase
MSAGPRRRPNGDLRAREHLTETEVERLIEAAKRNRHGHRDATMVLVAYRYGLRVSEPVDLRWEQVDLRTATLHVRRVKQSTLSTHPIFRRFVSSATEMARLANKPLRSLISDVLRRDFSCAVTRALQL